MRFKESTLNNNVGVALGLIGVLLAGVVIVSWTNPYVGLHKNKRDDDYRKEYRLATSPVHLKEKNNLNRRDWASNCMDHVGGGTTLAECTLSAKELYPEQDWVELAKSNMATMIQPKLN